MSLNTRIEHVSRVSVLELWQRWSTGNQVPKSLPLELVSNGKLRVQYFGYLTEWRPLSPVQAEAPQTTNQGIYGPIWLTLRPTLAYQLLSGTGLTLELQSGFESTVTDIVEPADVPIPAPGGYYQVILEPKGIRNPANLFIPTEDILGFEKSAPSIFEPSERADSSKSVKQSETELELRGNNLQVQINTLEAAIIVLTEAISAGDAKELIHQSGKDKGRLNCNALADFIIEERNRFEFLKENSSGELLRPGGTREAISGRIGKSLRQDLSRKVKSRAPRKESVPMEKNPL